MKRLLPVMLAFALVTPAAAQGQASDAAVCSALSAAYEDGLKELSWIFIASGGPVNATPVIEMMRGNVELMVARHCPVPARPIGFVAYADAVFACVHDQKIKSPLCDRSTWTANAPAPAATASAAP